MPASASVGEMRFSFGTAFFSPRRPTPFSPPPFAPFQISGGVNRCGDVRGQDDSSLSVHASCRRQAWNRLGDTCRNCRSARNAMYWRARSTARTSCILWRPSGSGSCDRSNPERRHTTRTSRSSAASLRTCRRSLRISLRRSASLRSATSTLTTAPDVAPSHPRAVERGTPRSLAMVTSPVWWTRSRSRWSERRFGRGVDVMGTIIDLRTTRLSFAAKQVAVHRW